MCKGISQIQAEVIFASAFFMSEKVEVLKGTEAIEVTTIEALLDKCSEGDLIKVGAVRIVPRTN